MNRAMSAFTLVEVCAVITILAIATGLATVGLRGATDNGKLQSAADRLTAQLHAAQLFALTARLPVGLNCSGSGCQVRKPVHRDGRWEWQVGSLATLPSGISLVSVQAVGAPPQSRDEGSWSISIRPDFWTSRFRFILAMVGRERSAAFTCGFGRRPEWDWESHGSEGP